MSELKSYEIPVSVEGIARIYARSEEEAIDILDNCRVMVAGNKMIHQHPIEFDPKSLKESK